MLGKGPGPKSLSLLKETLGSLPLPSDQAAALLAANAFAVPDEFPQVLGRLDQMKPGLGRRVSESLKTLGLSLSPDTVSSVYLRNGKMDPFFSADAVSEDVPLRR